MDISIEEQFDINDYEWTSSKCKWFLRFIQRNPDFTRIEMKPGDDNRLFLPKYLTPVDEMDRKFYEWKLKELDNIFIAIFRFLHKYYPDIIRYHLRTINDNKKNEWTAKYPTFRKDKHTSSDEAKLQNQFIEEVNDKWLQGFKYLYDFEYERGDHKGDLIFANDYGILAAAETKICKDLLLIYKKIKDVKEQAKKYKEILMKETEDIPNIITVIGVYLIERMGKKQRVIPLKIDKQIWEAIKKVYKLNNKEPPEFDIETIGEETLNKLAQEEDLNETTQELKVID